MEALRSSGFVQDDTLSLGTEPSGFVMSGEIACRGCIVINVYKELEVLDGEGPDARVQTVRYSYNASVRGHGVFLRFDNAHPHPGHSDAHHRHDIDWRTGKDMPGSPVWVGVHGWPTLGAFIEMVEMWYFENRDELPNPEAFPELGLGSR